MSIYARRYFGDLKAAYRRDPALFRDFALIAVAIIAITAANIVWVHEETRPPHWDMGGHLRSSLFYLDRLKHLSIARFIGVYYVYPPMIYWVVQPFYLVFGTDIATAVFSQSIFMIVLAYSVYGIGRTLWSPRVGLLATALILALPMFVSQFKEYQTDAPLSAVTALGLYMLIRCTEFSDRRYSILLGAALGIGLLTKWTLLLILFVPVAYAILVAAREDLRNRNYIRLLNAARAAAVATLLAAPWYLAHIEILVRTQLRNAGAQGAIEGDPPILSMDSNLRYFWTLINAQLYLIPFVLFCVGLLFFIARRENARRNIYPLLLIAGAYVILTLVRNKDARYIMPICSGVAVIAVYWIDQLKGRLLPSAAALAIVGYSAVAFVAISFGLGVIPKNESFEVGSQRIVVFAQHGYIIGPPTHEHWYQEDVIQLVAAVRDRPQTLLFQNAEDVHDTIWFNNAGLEYFAHRHGVDLVKDQKDATFILVRLPRNGEATVPTQFTKIDTYELPDQTRLVLMQRQGGDSTAGLP